MHGDFCIHDMLLLVLWLVDTGCQLTTIGIGYMWTRARRFTGQARSKLKECHESMLNQHNKFPPSKGGGFDIYG